MNVDVTWIRVSGMVMGGPQAPYAKDYPYCPQAQGYWEFYWANVVYDTTAGWEVGYRERSTMR